MDEKIYQMAKQLIVKIVSLASLAETRKYLKKKNKPENMNLFLC